jgi:mannose-6-phosphate isomerase-like protein (cupin superfamily)
MSEPDVTFSKLDPDAVEQRFQSLRRELEVTGFGINLIVLAPGERGRIHAHEHQEEVYLVLEGELTLGVEGEDQTLSRDAIVRVGPAVRRRLVNRGPERLVLLALGGSGIHAGRDARAWESWEETGDGRAPQEVPLPDDLPPG